MLTRALGSVDAEIGLDKLLDVYLRQHRGVIITLKGSQLNQQIAAVRLARLKVLNAVRLRHGIVGMTTVEIAQPGAIGINAIEVYTVVAGLAGIVPATEHNGAVVSHQGVKVVALVERDLFNVLAIIVHHMQDKRRAVTLLVQARVLGLTFIKQYRLGDALTGGGKNDSAIGQIGGRNVLPGPRSDVRIDDSAQGVGTDVVFPDIPGWLILVIGVFDFRGAHGEQQSDSIMGDMKIFNVVAQLAVVIEKFRPGERSGSNIPCFSIGRRTGLQ